MLNKVVENFDEAVKDIEDGATLMMFCWLLTGTPCNLIRALHDKGSKDLTVISHNFIPGVIGIAGTYHVLSQQEYTTPYLLAGRLKKLITAWPSPALMGVASELDMKTVEVEITSHGTLVERIRAGGSGIGGFYTRAGIGTVFEKDKEKKVIGGSEYLLETPIRADFSLVRAHKADRKGNLTYRVSGRGCNPIMAMAADITIAEVDEVLESGELNPEHIVTPGIFVDRVVQVPKGKMGSRDYMKELIRTRKPDEKKT